MILGAREALRVCVPKTDEGGGRGIADRKKRRLFLRKREQAFYSLFDRKITDVVKSGLKKKKKEVQVSGFNRNGVRFKLELVSENIGIRKTSPNSF